MPRNVPALLMTGLGLALLASSGLFSPAANAYFPTAEPAAITPAHSAPLATGAGQVAPPSRQHPGNQPVVRQAPTAPQVPADCLTTGSITLQDPSHTELVNSTGNPSVCPGVTCNGTFTSAPSNYDTYTYVNNMSSPQCITITIDSTGCAGAGLYSAAYQTSFDPNNPCTSFLGDTGVNPILGSVSYAVTVPANSTFIVEVEAYNAGDTCTSYTVAITGNVTCPGGGTATPTPGGGSSPTSTATVQATVVPATNTATATVVPATSTATATVCPIQFSDVQSSDPFYSYIRCLACRNILNGYSASPPCAPGGAPCFLGGNNITRGQVAKIVSNAAGFNDAVPSTQQTFGDVPFSDPFWLYIERLAETGRGYISGYSTSPPCPAGQVPCFLPGNPVTRGQMAKITANAASYTDAIPSTTQTFTDVPYGSAFWVYVERASLHGLISGYTSSPPCTTGTPCFLPGNNLTRNQAAKIVANGFFPNCVTPQSDRRNP